uniref:Uncharacterized protein n=1 Tax=Lactuca sativa TaxID=4236 RepID=A0A9R1VUH4_LACSA|nr:hypothetical protein LSAT_V11C400205310 [Lactuca sativa]
MFAIIQVYKKLPSLGPREFTPASIPISLPTTFPVITSQPSSTIPIPTPIFVDTTTTTTTRVQTNVSNTGVRSSPPEVPITTKHPYPTRSTETNIVLGGEDNNDDDDAPLTKHLKAVTDKLDQLLSSSSANPYSEAALKDLFSIAVKEHDTSISNASKAIDASTYQCLNASLVVEAFTKDCKDATTKAVLAVENKVVDELDKRTSQLKVHNLKLHTATQKLNDLKSEREVIRSSVGDVHLIPHHLLDAHDSILTISICHHLAEKLHPALDILSRIEGVSNTVVLPKQGGEKKS